MAEKLQALTQLRMANTRMEDYFDLWLLSRQPQLNKAILREAVERTFENRKMAIDTEPIGLSSAFGADQAKEIQWKAFLKRSALTAAPESLMDVVEEIRLFFEPILAHAGHNGIR